MGKEIRTYLFGVDSELKNLYGFKLQVIGNLITITQSDFSSREVYLEIPIKEWEELKSFIDNELKNI